MLFPNINCVKYCINTKRVVVVVYWHRIFIKVRRDYSKSAVCMQVLQVLEDGDSLYRESVFEVFNEYSQFLSKKLLEYLKIRVKRID